MAQFFVTNSKDLYTRLNERVEQTDFQKSFDYAKDDMYAIAWQPMCLSEKREYQYGDDWCIIAGLCIVKSSKDPQVIFDNYTHDVAEFRKACIGYYGLAVHKNGRTTISCDELGCHDIFYYDRDGEYLISNSIFDMAYVLQERVTLQEEKIIQKAVFHTLWNGETFYKEISRLQANQQIEIKANKAELNTMQYDMLAACAAHETIDTIIPKLAQRLKEIFKSLTDAVGVPTILMTGGMDSRLMLASFLSVGIKPKLLYLRGFNWGDTQDEHIVRLYAEKFDLSYEVEDLRNYSTTQDEYECQVLNHGYQAAYSWGANAKALKHFVATNNCLLIGWGGEHYRHMEYVKNIDEFVKYYYNFSHNLNELNRVVPQLVDNYKKSILNEMSHWGVEPSTMNQEEWFFMQVVGGARRDMWLPILLQQYGYMCCPLMEASAQAYLVSLYKEGIDGSTFQIRLVRELYPKLLELPIFSCRREWFIDPHTLALTMQNPKLTQAKKNTLLKYIWDKAPKGLKKNILKPIREKVYKRTTIPTAEINGVELNVADKVKMLWRMVPTDVTYPISFSNTNADGFEEYAMYCLSMFATTKLNTK